MPAATPSQPAIKSGTQGPGEHAIEPTPLCASGRIPPNNQVAPIQNAQATQAMARSGNAPSNDGTKPKTMVSEELEETERKFKELKKKEI